MVCLNLPKPKSHHGLKEKVRFVYKLWQMLSIGSLAPNEDVICQGMCMLWGHACLQRKVVFQGTMPSTSMLVS